MVTTAEGLRLMQEGAKSLGQGMKDYGTGVNLSEAQASVLRESPEAFTGGLEGQRQAGIYTRLGELGAADRLRKKDPDTEWGMISADIMGKLPPEAVAKLKGYLKMMRPPTGGVTYDAQLPTAVTAELDLGNPSIYKVDFQSKAFKDNKDILVNRDDVKYTEKTIKEIPLLPDETTTEVMQRGWYNVKQAASDLATQESDLVSLKNAAQSNPSVKWTEEHAKKLESVQDEMMKFKMDESNLAKNAVRLMYPDVDIDYVEQYLPQEAAFLKANAYTALSTNMGYEIQRDSDGKIKGVTSVPYKGRIPSTVVTLANGSSSQLRNLIKKIGSRNAMSKSKKQESVKEYFDGKNWARVSE